MNYRLLILCCGLLCSVKVFSQSSVLADGKWLKVAINQSGMYALSFNQLQSAGVDPSTINPQKIKVYGNPGGMLPQANAAERPFDLIEKNILVTGEGDGVFNSNDQIIFYAEGPDKVRWNTGTNFLTYEQNLYSRQHFVFIQLDGDNGKRVATENITTAAENITDFVDVHHYENSFYNLVRSGRTWLGERISNSSSFNYSIPWAGVKSNVAVKIQLQVANAATAISNFKLRINGNEAGNIVVNAISGSRYGVKYNLQTANWTSNTNALGMVSINDQSVSLLYEQTSSGSGSGYLDYLTVNVTRNLALYNNQTIFRSPASVAFSSVNYVFQNTLPSGASVWNITEPGEEKIQTINNNRFGALTNGELQEYIVFSSYLTPASIASISNQNLKMGSAVELVIITTPALKEEAIRLADHRNTFSGIITKVVLQEEVFNEFSGGKADVTAIRDYARFLYQQQAGSFKYLLLFGKGTFDYLNVLNKNNNIILTYESRNSFAPLETYSSDDYFALLEDDEGLWNECPGCDETLDIGVGRFSITTIEEAKNIVDKIIDYETNTKNRGSWQKKITFVADDGNSDDGFSTKHQKDANDLAQQIETSSGSVFVSEKIFMGSYPKVTRPSGQTAPEVNIAIKNALEEGTLVINYVGHGNEFLWADERILDEQLLVDTRNNILPFMVTATCEFGRHDDPEVTSVAELFHHRAKHGAIGLVTTSRPVFSQSNFELNTAFYQAFLLKDNGVYLRLGDIFRQTKNNSNTGVSNRNFSLLGDPSMRLQFPELPIAITEVENQEANNIIKALSTVTIRGEVKQSDGITLAANFNGEAEIVIHDKPQTFRTIPNPNTYTYQQWDNRLFSGKAKVVDGEFVFSFVTPNTINYTLGNGRISVYAKSTSATAGGIAFAQVGGSSLPENPENDAPQLKAYMNDSTFINGGIVSPNVRLYVETEDENGINISGFGVGNDLIAILDGNEVYELRNYYQAKSNTFKKGIIDFPLKELTEGPHQIVVKAWDVLGNMGETKVDFIVTSPKELLVTQAGSIPNPTSGETKIFVRHNAAGETLEANIDFYQSNGAKYAVSYAISEDVLNKATIFTFDASQLPAGMYYARVFLRSLSTNRTTQATAKLIVTK